MASNPSFSPYNPPGRGRFTLVQRLRWTTHLQMWEFTNGGLLTGEAPTPVSLAVQPVGEPEGSGTAFIAPHVETQAGPIQTTEEL